MKVSPPGPPAGRPPAPAAHHRSQRGPQRRAGRAGSRGRMAASPSSSPPAPPRRTPSASPPRGHPPISGAESWPPACSEPNQPITRPSRCGAVTAPLCRTALVTRSAPPDPPAPITAQRRRHHARHRVQHVQPVPRPRCGASPALPAGAGTSMTTARQQVRRHARRGAGGPRRPPHSAASPRYPPPDRPLNAPVEPGPAIRSRLLTAAPLVLIPRPPVRGGADNARIRAIASPSASASPRPPRPAPRAGGRTRALRRPPRPSR